MPPRASQATVLSAEQVQLLCQVVQHSEPPTRTSWDIIAGRLNITNGHAAQRRFWRLLKILKSAEPSGISDGKPPRPKIIGKRAAPSKQNGNTFQKSKVYINNTELEDDDDPRNEHKFEEEEMPSKKSKTTKQNGTQEWKSIFERNHDVITIEEDEKGEFDAITIKTEDELDAEDVI